MFFTKGNLEATKKGATFNIHLKKQLKVFIYSCYYYLSLYYPSDSLTHRKLSVSHKNKMLKGEGIWPKTPQGPAL